MNTRWDGDSLILRNGAREVHLCQVSEARELARSSTLEPLAIIEALWLLEGLWRGNILALRVFAQRLQLCSGVPLSEWDDHQLREAIANRIKRGELTMFGAAAGGTSHTPHAAKRGNGPLVRPTQQRSLAATHSPVRLRPPPAPLVPTRSPPDHLPKADLKAGLNPGQPSSSAVAPSSLPIVDTEKKLPHSILVRLHFFFNTNKTFLLPTALPEVQRLRQLYLDNASSKLLVVGHADTRGGTAYNDKLSLQRAEATIAYLKDDVEAWFKSYSDPEPKKKWGKIEDHLMIIAMPDFVTKPKGEEQVRWYQRTRSLGIDGDAGPETRRALIKEYMSLDGASLGKIEAVAHGCGENFPLDETEQQLDTAPADQKRDPGDRRVDLFFFDPEFGITPPPPGTNSAPASTEYPLWRKGVAEVVDLNPSADGLEVTFVEISDAHFRTDSAVVLPEGEDPDQNDEHQALTSVGLIATALRFNEEHAGRSVFVAGHTDTAAGDQLNDELSRLRARVALALLEGDRETFKELCHQRHKNADINQILSWVSEAFEDLVFDCKPGAINNYVNDQTVRKFQRAYNKNKSALGATQPDLTDDGSVGKLTWGAFFDCYELALQQELGVDAGGLVDLRALLGFTDPTRKSLGFGERFPIEELGVDEFRSQTNRRVEILFFEPSEEPDLAHAEADPETSELYLPGHYERFPLEPMLSAKPFKARWDVPTASIDVIRQMQLSAPGLSAGTPLAIEVRLVAVGTIATLTASSNAGGAEIPFNDWDAPADVPFVGDLEAGQEFPASLVEFVIEGGGRRVQAKPLTYADSATIILTLDDEGDQRILADENYVVCTPFGRRRGVTDAQGQLVETKLPIGGALLALRARHLVHRLVLDHGWDGED